ncbi:DUF2059 domain-containing protein [Sphingomonas abietis]|uniref:DUF2059 domain-containing protein n=1 Tax=Sphingomonas abietis TaxID=3012344 RepID=A0ABY7NJ66_9SPHN|nr:DUF2059 domain-containing protein [Sphingomonas abietis]WBO21582.1 DUF2059 domain-containing protein [Sphingomonas abietis]
MIRRLLLVSAVGALAAAALPAWADVAPAPAAPAAATPDAATMAAARALMRATDIQAQMRAIGPRMGQAVTMQLQQSFADHQLPTELQSQIAGAMQDFVGSMDTMFTPQLIDQMAAIYARHFTAADLQHLSQMMQDPAMVRFRKVMPDTLAEMMPLIMTAMRPQQDAFQARIQKIVADWIQQHPEDQAKLRSPTAH